MSIQFNHVLVVEGPILRGYYNFLKFTNEVFRVVEDPILRDDHNHQFIAILVAELLKAPFWGLHNPEGKKPEYGYNIDLDRIQSKPRERSLVEYVPAPKHFYYEFFKDIVGVSHKKDAQKEHIVIRARSLYIFKLMDTKPIHQSYIVVKPYAQYVDGEYAESSVDVEPNNEFFGRILQMGAGLEIVSPESVRDEMAKRVQDLTYLYPKKE